MPDAGDLPHPHAALWAQANAIQNIKSLIPVTLDLKASNFTKWRQFLNIAVTQYALADHLDAVPPPADEEWQRMDSTVLRWLYGSVAPDISDMVMAAGTTASAVLGAITALFRDNQQARAGYLGQKFRNIEQLDKSVTAYCLEQKTVADALADVNAPVSDDALVWNTIKGLNDHYKDIGNLAPLLTPFPTFLQFRNMLLLQELKPSNTSSSSPSAFYTAPPAGGPRGSSRSSLTPGAPASAPPPATARAATRARRRTTGATAPPPSLACSTPDWCHLHAPDDGSRQPHRWHPQVAPCRSTAPPGSRLHGLACPVVRTSIARDIHLQRLPQLRLPLDTDMGSIRPRKLLQHHELAGPHGVGHGHRSIRSHVFGRWISGQGP